MPPWHLASGEVHSWCVRLDVPSETTADFYATLSSDERNRSARLRFERDRQRFIVAHGVLRAVLGRYLESPADQIRYVYNAFGKPALGLELASRLTFNLSHSADLALIAVAAGADIGVDLEHIRTQPDFAEIARYFFSAAEVDRLNALPSRLQARAFLSCWTKREAYVKACGEGLANTPSALDGRWSLYSLEPAPGYIGALVVAGSGRRLTQWQWQSPAPV